jgi:predicted DNA-binding transcriptional regulator YafY
MARASDAQKAERLNLARALLREYEHLPEATERLARDCSISRRQAYRYLEQAQQLKRPVPVGDMKLSFTVKLSRSLIDRLRDYAASTGLTLSEIATRAFSAVLHRGGGRG